MPDPGNPKSKGYKIFMPRKLSLRSINSDYIILSIIGAVLQFNNSGEIRSNIDLNTKGRVDIV